MRLLDAARGRIFTRWTTFCAAFHVKPSLHGITCAETRLCYLLVFGLQIRRAGQTGRPVQADTVEDALLAMGQGITHLGEPDP